MAMPFLACGSDRKGKQCIYILLYIRKQIAQKMMCINTYIHSIDIFKKCFVQVQGPLHDMSKQDPHPAFGSSISLPWQPFRCAKDPFDFASSKCSCRKEERVRCVDTHHISSQEEYDTTEGTVRLKGRSSISLAFSKEELHSSASGKICIIKHHQETK